MVNRPRVVGALAAAALAAGGAAAVVSVRARARTRARVATGAGPAAGPGSGSAGAPDRPRGTAELPAGQVRTVWTADGVPLYVEEVGDPDAPLVVVFVHGFTMTAACWYYQRRELAVEGVRLVFYDQRGHGRSGPGAPSTYTIDTLGTDLAHVLDERAAGTPAVLVGHSMGGMAILALAAQAPHLFAPGGPVRGVALISSTSGRMGELTFGLPGVLVPRVAPALDRAAALLARVPGAAGHRRRAGAVSRQLIGRVAFGRAAARSAALVEFVDAMDAATPLGVASAFIPTFFRYDQTGSLAALRAVETLVIVGTEDRLTPPSHGQAIERELPAAEVLVLPGVGHMAMLEQPERVTGALRGLVQRAAATAGVPAPR